MLIEITKGSDSVMRFLILFMLVVVHSAYSEEGVFLSDISSDMSSSKLNKEIEQTFIGRRWRVIEVDDGSGVTARIIHKGVDATVTIYKSGAHLLYICKGTREVKRHDPSEGVRKVIIKDFCPTKWIDFLRQDVTWVLKPN